MSNYYVSSEETRSPSSLRATGARAVRSLRSRGIIPRPRLGAPRGENEENLLRDGEATDSDAADDEFAGISANANSNSDTIALPSSSTGVASMSMSAGSAPVSVLVPAPGQPPSSATMEHTFQQQQPHQTQMLTPPLLVPAGMAIKPHLPLLPVKSYSSNPATATAKLPTRDKDKKYQLPSLPASSSSDSPASSLLQRPISSVTRSPNLAPITAASTQTSRSTRTKSKPSSSPQASIQPSAEQQQQPHQSRTSSRQQQLQPQQLSPRPRRLSTSSTSDSDLLSPPLQSQMGPYSRSNIYGYIPGPDAATLRMTPRTYTNPSYSYTYPGSGSASINGGNVPSLSEQRRHYEASRRRSEGTRERDRGRDRELEKAAERDTERDGDSKSRRRERQREIEEQERERERDRKREPLAPLNAVIPPTEAVTSVSTTTPRAGRSLTRGEKEREERERETDNGRDTRRERNRGSKRLSQPLAQTLVQPPAQPTTAAATARPDIVPTRNVRFRNTLLFSPTPPSSIPPSPAPSASQSRSPRGRSRPPLPGEMDPTVSTEGATASSTLPPTPTSPRATPISPNALKPSHPPRRPGWYNSHGDQLWTNNGGYVAPAPGFENPPDLADFPARGTGWMNCETGRVIDMAHRLIKAGWNEPSLPRASGSRDREKERRDKIKEKENKNGEKKLKSALKRRT